MKMLRILALPLGFVLDLILGDPSWIRHPVCWIGDLISALEKRLRKIFPDTPGGLLTAGIVMVFQGFFLAKRKAPFKKGLWYPWISIIIQMRKSCKYTVTAPDAFPAS